MNSNERVAPPAAHDHQRWHWVDTEHGMQVASWFSNAMSGGVWDISGHMFRADSPRILRKWAYIGPAIPPSESTFDMLRKYETPGAESEYLARLATKFSAMENPAAIQVVLEYAAPNIARLHGNEIAAISDHDAESFGFICEMGVGLVIRDDLPPSQAGERWLSWDETVVLSKWLAGKVRRQG